MCSKNDAETGAEEGPEMVVLKWHQESKPCSVCGSYYTVDGKCNKCHPEWKEKNVTQ